MKKTNILFVALLPLLWACGNELGKEELDLSTSTAAVVAVDESLDEGGAGAFADHLNTAQWRASGYGFYVPEFMRGGTRQFVGGMPADVITWSSGLVELSVWPMLGAWAVDGYPCEGHHLGEDVHVKEVTLQDDPIYAGTTTDGRLWYLRKQVIEDEQVNHAKALVLVYPEDLKEQVGKLKDMVEKWKN